MNLSQTKKKERPLSSINKSVDTQTIQNDTTNRLVQPPTKGHSKRNYTNSTNIKERWIEMDKTSKSTGALKLIINFISLTKIRIKTRKKINDIIEEGEIYFNAGNFEKAEEKYKQALEEIDKRGKNNPRIDKKIEKIKCKINESRIGLKKDQERKSTDIATDLNLL